MNILSECVTEWINVASIEKYFEWSLRPKQQRVAINSVMITASVY